MPVNQSVIVTGPQGCGKTRDAMKIRNHFGLTWIIDSWDGKAMISQYRLYLTNIPIVELRRNHRRAMIVNYADVMAQIEMMS